MPHYCDVTNSAGGKVRELISPEDCGKGTKFPFEGDCETCGTPVRGTVLVELLAGADKATVTLIGNLSHAEPKVFCATGPRITITA